MDWALIDKNFTSIAKINHGKSRRRDALGFIFSKGSYSLEQLEKDALEGAVSRLVGGGLGNAGSKFLKAPKLGPENIGTRRAAAIFGEWHLVRVSQREKQWWIQKV